MKAGAPRVTDSLTARTAERTREVAAFGAVTCVWRGAPNVALFWLFKSNRTAGFAAHGHRPAWQGALHSGNLLEAVPG